MLTLLGIAVVIIGFVLRFNPLLVVVVALMMMFPDAVDFEVHDLFVSGLL